MARLAIAVAATTLVFAVESPAHAQAIDGTVRLSLDATVFSNESVTLEPKDDGAQSISVTDSSFGLFASSLGLGIGYGSSDSLVIGARLQQGTTTRKFDSDQLGTYETSQLSFLPYLEVVFSPDSTFRPYLGATLGVRAFQISNADTKISDGSALVIGLGAGGHIFATEDFSVDPALNVFRVSGTETVGDAEFEHAGWAVVGSFSFSGWLGAERSRRRAALAEPQESSTMGEGVPISRAVDAQPASGAADSTKTNGGVVSASMRLTGGTLILAGRPEKDGRNVVVRVQVLSPSSRFRDCRDVSLVAAGKSFPVAHLKYAKQGGGASVMEAVQGTVSADAVASLGEATGPAVVKLCDFELAAGIPERKRIYAFFEAFNGIEPGSWAPPAGVTSERGLFSTTLRVKNVELNLSGHPRRDAEHLAVRLRSLDSSPDFNSCRELGIFADGESRATAKLVHHAAAGGFSSTEILTATVAVSALGELSQAADSAELRVCGTTLQLISAKRKRVQGLLSAFSGYAKKVAPAPAEEEPEVGPPPAQAPPTQPED